MARMIQVCTISHTFQLARVSASCSFEEVPNTNPLIFSGEGASVQ